MTEAQLQNWKHFQENYFEFPEIHFELDLSRMNLPAGFIESLERRFATAFQEMKELEAGAIANKDEGRMVGHYWLRNPDLSPSAEIRDAIKGMIVSVQDFASKVHSGEIAGTGGRFTDLLLIGIGGSALGPQFVGRALGHPSRDKLRLHVIDNTDPDGMERVFAEIGGLLKTTLCIVISKSGGTKETRNGMLEAKAAFERERLEFNRHVVAVTQLGSALDQYASREKWIARFPMWDWVGGRTSEMSAVGLLPAALQGIDTSQLLAGARVCDQLTRSPELKKNPAALLAAVWLHATRGVGERNMVVLPYRDSLELFSKYLQQLVMESLGKRYSRRGEQVHQGLTVLGNKGATDQHSYVQQLRDGLDDFFVTFIEVLVDSADSRLEVEDYFTTSDYLHSFLLGTQEALSEAGRLSCNISLRDVSAHSIGALIALFERTVGYYASMIDINAYHQPGVEAGKIAATKTLSLSKSIMTLLKGHSRSLSTAQIVEELGFPTEADTVFRVCKRFSATGREGIQRFDGRSIADAKFGIKAA